MMKLDELANKIAALKDVTPVGDSRTFMCRVPFSKKNILFFVRPVADDLIVASSVMNSTDEDSLTLGRQILTVAETLAAKARSAIAIKISGVDWGLPNFDSLLMLGPSVEKFRMTKDDFFLPSRTVGAFAINHIEFSGDETEAEAIVRRGHVILSDVTREITPVIFLRYHKQTGQRSAEHLAIAKHNYTTVLISELPRDGGTVELENYERAGMILATDQGDTNLAVTFDGKSKKLPVVEALKLMDVLTYKSADDAKKVW